jgi:hypothetical protein
MFGNMPFGNVPFRSGLLGNERIDDAPRVPGRLLFATRLFRPLVLPEARHLLSLPPRIEQQLGAAERSDCQCDRIVELVRRFSYATIRRDPGRTWRVDYAGTPTFRTGHRQRFVIAVANA